MPRKSSGVAIAAMSPASHLRRVGAQVLPAHRPGRCRPTAGPCTSAPSRPSSSRALCDGLPGGRSPARTGERFSTMPRLALAAVGPQGLQRQAVAQQQVVGHLHGGGAVAEAGREDAVFVAQLGHHPGLVVGGDRWRCGRPRRRFMLQRVVDEAVHRVARWPSRPASCRTSRQVPVVQRQVGLACRGPAGHRPGARRRRRPASGSTRPAIKGCTRGHDTLKSGRQSTPRSGDEVQVLRPDGGTWSQATSPLLPSAMAPGTWRQKLSQTDSPLPIDRGRPFDLVRAGGHAPDESRAGKRWPGSERRGGSSWIGRQGRTAWGRVGVAAAGVATPSAG